MINCLATLKSADPLVERVEHLPCFTSSSVYVWCVRVGVGVVLCCAVLCCVVFVSVFVSVFVFVFVICCVVCVSCCVVFWFISD